MFFGSIPALVTPFSGGRVAEEFEPTGQLIGANRTVPKMGGHKSLTFVPAAKPRRSQPEQNDALNMRVPIVANCLCEYGS